MDVPPNTFINLPLDLFGGDQESDSETQYEINDTRKDLVEEVYLTAFRIEVVSPASEDLSFLKSASFFIDAEDLAEILVAEKDPVPDNTGNELSFDVASTSNLAEYIKQEPFEIRANVVTGEQRTQTIRIKGTATFDVTASVIGG